MASSVDGGNSGRIRSSAGARRSATEPRSHRIPPHDLAAEKAVLSSILLDDHALDAVLTELTPTDFYHPAHRTIFESMILLREARSPVDLLTLSSNLADLKLLDAVGGAAFLAEISDFETTAAHVVHHARIVRDKAARRALISAATEIVEQGFESAESSDQLLNLAQGQIFALGQSRARKTFAEMSAEVHEAMDFVDAIMDGRHTMGGLKTGFIELDQKTGGLQPGDLIIVAARPSMGKTAFALNIARNAAVELAKKVAIFSLEMTARSLVLRLLSAEAAVDAGIFRRDAIATHDYNKIKHAAATLSETQIFIDDGSAATVLEIEAKARRLSVEHGLDLVIVDYLQLARGDGRAERREQEISEISRGLKGLAKELGIPVVALSQLNRGPEARADKRPMLADLRESGAIEQDADVIAFIYRDEVYNKDTDDLGTAEIIIAKQRNGPTGMIRLQFEGKYTRFANLATRTDAPLEIGAGNRSERGVGLPARAGFEDDGF